MPPNHIQKGIAQMNTDKTYTITLTEEEMMIVHDVFDELTRENLHEWTKLIPKHGEYRSTECFQQWLLTGKFNDIRHKASISLGYEEEKSEEQVLKEANEAIEKYEREAVIKIFEGKL